MERGNRRLQYLITSAVSITGILVGATFSWPTAVIPKFFNDETGFHLTETEISWVVGTVSLGYLFGSVCSRCTSDRHGRRATFLISLIPAGIGTICLIFAREIWLLSVSRFFLGCSSGLLQSKFLYNFFCWWDGGLPPWEDKIEAAEGNTFYGLDASSTRSYGVAFEVSSIYLAEISDSEIRGSLLLCNRFMFSFGNVLVMTIGPFVSYQTINFMYAVLPVFNFTTCWFIPETPYFLLKQEKVNAARQILLKLTGIKDEQVVEERLSKMREDVKKDMTRSSSIKELLTGKRYRKAIIIVVGLKVTQVMAGLHAIQLYLGPIIQESNSGMTDATALISFGVVRLIIGIISSQLVDRLGRRPLLIYSFLATGICLFVIGLYFFINSHYNTVGAYSYYSHIPYVGIMIAIFSAVLGFESVVYMISAELFPINIKSLAMTATNMFAAFIHFIAMISYQQIKDLGGLTVVFWVYAAFCFAGSIFSVYYVLETKKKSLRDIQIELQGDLYDDGDKLPPDNINNISKGAIEDTELESLKKKDVV